MRRVGLLVRGGVVSGFLMFADGGVETLTLLSAGVCRLVAFRRGKFGRIVMADGTVTTATALAARIRKWLAIGNAPAAGRE